MLKIAIAGQACAGKTSVSNYINEYDTEIGKIKFADPLYAINDALGVKKQRYFMQDMSDLAKKHFGMDIFVKIFHDSVDKQPDRSYSEIIVCDDMRYVIEYQSCYKDWVVIYIDAKEDIRKKRSDNLGLEWNPDHPSEKECLEFKDLCLYQIINNGTKEELYKQIDSIILDLADKSDKSENYELSEIAYHIELSMKD